MDDVRGRGRTPSDDATTAVKFHRFFNNKVSMVWSLTADAQPPSFTVVPPRCRQSIFKDFTIKDVLDTVGRLPDEQSLSDPDVNTSPQGQHQPTGAVRCQPAEAFAVTILVTFKAASITRC